MRHVLWVLVGVVMVLGVVGCKSSQSPIFFTSPESPYPDVPVPASFVMVSQSPVGSLPPTSGRAME